MAAQLNLNTEKIEKIKTQVQSINDTANAQATTIAEIAALLEGKSVPGSGEDVTAETETYTDLLADLEAAVNALPNAGSGGYQMSMGKFTVSSQVTAVSTTAATVSGLSFMPKIVVILLGASKSQSSSAPSVYYVSGLYNAETKEHRHIRYGKQSSSSSTTGVSIYNSQTVYEITINDKGFSLGRGTSTTTGLTYYIASGKYYYIAIG